MTNLVTERLILMPITLSITNSLLEKNNCAIKELGYNIHHKWPTDDTMDILPIIKETLEKDKEPSGFETWMIIKRENNMVIGDIGFHGKPDENGEVEVGYGLVIDERNKGYGFEALNAILNWALSINVVNVIKAECLNTNIPSKKILKKAGMVEINKDDTLTYFELVK